MSFDFVYFFYLINLFSSINGHEKASGKLLFVSIVYRHGDRSPKDVYPLDPHSDICHWPNGMGQLTRLGKLQQYELGQWLRHRFWDFLPVRYNASDIYVRSSDADRALTSAYCNLAGLYECWNEEDGDGLAWQPIPVHTMPEELDSVLAARMKCPAYERIYHDILKIDEVSRTCKKYEGMFANLSSYTGLNIQTVEECTKVYDCLYVESNHGLQLPDWTKQFYPQPLKELTEFAASLPCYTTPAKRLKCGPLVKDIVQNMRSKMVGNITQKMWMYSGHAHTLTNTLQCLGAFNGEIPPFTSSLIFELFKDGDNYFVRVSYRTPTQFKVLSLGDCHCVCSFEDFEKIVTPIMPVDWEKECLKR